MSGVAGVELIFLLLLAFVTAFALLASKLDTPYPIVLVLGGLVLGIVPGMPRITLDPQVIFLVVLPPLLYSAAWQTSWRDFRYNIVSIGLLAFGLVGFLVAAVTWLAPHMLTGFNAGAGFILGAVVAPTDAIAATSIARRVGLPRRIVDVLEGESLINDASGLLALEFGIAYLVRGQMPTVTEGMLRLLWLTVGGIVVGLIVGYVVAWVERKIDDGPIEITLGFLVPYTAYLLAEKVHASGVMAVVACGLLLSRQSAGFFSPKVRLQAWSVWEAFTFALNGLVFVLIGLQLPLVLEGLRDYSLGTLVVSGLLFSVLLILLRLAWTFPGAHLANYFRRCVLHQNEPKPSMRQIFVVGWTGMRGVIALAAALALPLQGANGEAFSQRPMIVFLTFSAILVTLILQGLSLPPMIRALGLAGASGPNCEEYDARRLMLEAAIQHIEGSRSHDQQEFAGVYDDLAQHYRDELAELRGGNGDGDNANGSQNERHRNLAREVLGVERQTLIALRDEGRISDEVLRDLERKLDLGETRLH